MDLLRDLTEATDKRMKAQLLFKIMDKMYDDLESIHDRLESGRAGKLMAELGYGRGELEGLKRNIANTLEEFGDFMPGLEMEARGKE